MNCLDVAIKDELMIYLRNTVLPPIQPPDNNLYFDRTEYTVSRYPPGRTEVEAHDELYFGHSNGVSSDRNGLIGNISNRTEETTLNSTNIANSSITVSLYKSLINLYFKSILAPAKY